jgi:hypothetical protein
MAGPPQATVSRSDVDMAKTIRILRAEVVPGRFRWSINLLRFQCSGVRAMETHRIFSKIICLLTPET